MDKITQNKNQRLLGIDYGSKRIGVALTNEMGDMALPYSVVQNTKDAVADILKICTEHTVSKIIIGESKNFEQQNNDIMEDIQKFADTLHEQSGIDVILHPEFMTSAQAEHMQGKNDMLDASAATIILQSYMDSHIQ